MNKSPRTDKRKNVGKVAEVLAENPNKTARELAEDTGLGVSTANRARQELAQSGTKDETIAYIVTSAKNRIRKASDIFDRYVNEIEEKEELNGLDIRNLKDIAKDDQARITVLGGNITDKDGGLKENSLVNLSDSELLILINNGNSK